MARKQLYNTYYMWRCLPDTVKGLSESALKKQGISNAMASELLGIRTQTEFCTHFKVNKATLTNWNKKIAEEGGLMDGVGTWAKLLTNNVMYALYKKTLITGDAARVEAWMNYVEGQGKKVDLTLSEFLSQAPSASRTDEDTD